MSNMEGQFCSSCGRKLAGDRICSTCGKAVGEAGSSLRRSFSRLLRAVLALSLFCLVAWCVQVLFGVVQMWTTPGLRAEVERCSMGPTKLTAALIATICLLIITGYILIRNLGRAGGLRHTARRAAIASVAIGSLAVYLPLKTLYDESAQVGNGLHSAMDPQFYSEFPNHIQLMMFVNALPGSTAFNLVLLLVVLGVAPRGNSAKARCNSAT